METGKHISSEKMEDYVDERLMAPERSHIQTHLKECQACREKADNLKRVTQELERWSAESHGHVYRQTPSKTRMNVGNQIISVLSRQDDSKHDEAFLLAAVSGEKMESKNATLGVAIDKESGKGCVVEIVAWVEHKGQPDLEIVVPEVTGVTKGDRGYSQRPPSENLKKKLRALMKNIPALAALGLKGKDIYVEIKTPIPFQDLSSLMLAIIVAIAKATVGYTDEDRCVYSAEVDPQGGLSSVGEIREKAAVVFSQGRGEGLLVVSERDYMELRDTVSSSQLSFIRGYRHLEDVFKHVGLPHKGINITTFFLLILGIAGSCVAFLLTFVSGNIYAMGDMIIAWSIADQGSTIIKNIMLLRDALWKFVIPFLGGWLGLSFRYPKLRVLKAPRSLLGWVSVSLLVFFLSYLALTVLRVKEFNSLSETFSVYKEIEYIKYSKVLKDLDFVKKTPNVRYTYFKTLSSSQDAKDLAEAVKVGLGARVDDEKFRDIFWGISDILANRIQNRAYGKQALSKYVEFVNLVKNRPDGKSLIVDTIPLAEDLMKKFDLQKEPYGGTTLEHFLKETSAYAGRGKA